jgi:hypothetical protein
MKEAGRSRREEVGGSAAWVIRSFGPVLSGDWDEGQGTMSTLWADRSDRSVSSAVP